MITGSPSLSLHDTHFDRLSVRAHNESRGLTAAGHQTRLKTPQRLAVPIYGRWERWDSPQQLSSKVLSFLNTSSRFPARRALGAAAARECISRGHPTDRRPCPFLLIMDTALTNFSFAPLCRPHSCPHDALSAGLYIQFYLLNTDGGHGGFFQFRGGGGTERDRAPICSVNQVNLNFVC